MAIQVKKFPSNSMLDTPVREVIRHQVAGNITTDSVLRVAAPFDFKFESIGQTFLRLGTTGVDGTDPLLVELEVTKNGTTIFATKPAIGPTAADGSTSLTAGVGITVGALSATPAALVGVKGDLIVVTIDVTRTTPDTEAADCEVCVILHELSDYDPDLGEVRP